MTSIVGLVDNGVVYIGGDSASSDNHSNVLSNAIHKVFYIGSDFLIGHTVSYRMGQILQFHFKPPVHDIQLCDDYQYMATHFIEAVKEVFKKYDLVIDKEMEWSGIFLVGYKGQLFMVTGDLSVEMSNDNYMVVGVGIGIAAGALYATEDLMMLPEQRVLKALEAVTKFYCWVEPPFIIKQL